jgi:UDP-glucuronate decarboxylase
VILEDVRNIVERAMDSLWKLEGKSLVITGASGMLASYMMHTLAFLNRNIFSTPCRVTAISRRRPRGGHPLAYALSAPGINYVAHDARTVPAGVPEMDYLLLMATYGSPAKYMSDPLGTMQLNSSALFEWLEEARKNKGVRVSYFSSGEIYGSTDDVREPISEEHIGRFDHTAPRAVYGESKRFGETVCLTYARRCGLHVNIVRPFHVFGPGMESGDGRAMADFLFAAAAGKPIMLKSAGNALRTFMYVADAAVAFWKILLDGAAETAYNVGTSSPEMTIKELAEKIAMRARSKPEIRFEEEIGSVKGSPLRTCPDVSRLAGELNFTPKFSIDDLIDRTLLWLEDRRI